MSVALDNGAPLNRYKNARRNADFTIDQDWQSYSAADTRPPSTTAGTACSRARAKYSATGLATNSWQRCMNWSCRNRAFRTSTS
jgi:hypothetical protein